MTSSFVMADTPEEAALHDELAAFQAIEDGEDLFTLALEDTLDEAVDYGLEAEIEHHEETRQNYHLQGFSDDLIDDFL